MAFDADDISESERLPDSPLTKLEGRWVGRAKGWRLRPLPCVTAAPPGGFFYQLVASQFAEDLLITSNPGVFRNSGLVDSRPPQFLEEELVSFRYVKSTRELASDSSPYLDGSSASIKRAYTEVGMWLHSSEPSQVPLSIVYLSAQPAGVAEMSLGNAEQYSGPPKIAVCSAMPHYPEILADSHPFLRPYRRLIDVPFKGSLSADKAFPGWHPLDVHAVLAYENVNREVLQTTSFSVSTQSATGGIRSTPFVSRQISPISVQTVFWVQEFAGESGATFMRMQYSRVAALGFDVDLGILPAQVVWYDVTVNTLDRVH